MPLPPESRPSTPTWRAMPAFLVSGVLLAFLGAVLPAWGHHLRASFGTIGHHFLALNGGMLLAVPVVQRVMRGRTVRPALVSGCVVGFAALLYLSFVPPPLADAWRIVGIFAVGVAAGLINAAAFHATSAVFRADPAGTLVRAGASFGLGCLLSTLLVALTFHSASSATILMLIALIPGMLAIYFVHTRAEQYGPAPEQLPWRSVLPQLTNPGAVLFSLLLFFQFGNEWGIAAWLPLFLIQRIGVNPASALFVLAVYWLALFVARFAARWWLPHANHWKLLIGSGVGAVFGCFMLALTNNLFGASIGAMILGLSFAPIYPIAVEKIGDRFPSYHPGVFNGLFSFGLTGGILAPAHLGYLAEWLGIGVVMVLPVLGTCMVVLLSVLIWVESRFGSRRGDSPLSAA